MALFFRATPYPTGQPSHGGGVARLIKALHRRDAPSNIVGRIMYLCRPQNGLRPRALRGLNCNATLRAERGRSGQDDSFPEDDSSSSLSLSLEQRSEVPPRSTERLDPRTALSYRAGMEIAKLSYRHRAIMDMMLANPTMTQGEIAARLGYTQTWVSLISGSDLFKLEFERRRRNLEGEQSRVITAKLIGIAQKGLSAIDRGLEPDPMTGASPAPRVALDSTSLALRALGFLDSAKPQVNMTVNAAAPVQINTVDPRVLAEARNLMKKLHSNPEADNAIPAGAETLPLPTAS